MKILELWVKNITKKQKKKESVEHVKEAVEQAKDTTLQTFGNIINNTTNTFNVNQNFLPIPMKPLSNFFFFLNEWSSLCDFYY